MHKLSAFIQSHPLLAFFIPACVGLGATVPLAAVAPEFPPFVLSVLPALLAFILVALAEGKAGIRALLSSLARWRVAPYWYAVVWGLPLLGTLTMAALAALGVSPTAWRLGQVSWALFIIAYVFNGAEEVGWRGYVLPRLLQGRSRLAASLILGVLWAVFHLPLYLPGQMYANLPVWPVPLILVAYAILLTWVFIHTQGSLLMTTLLHGTMNALTPLTAGIDPIQAWMLRAVVFGGFALLLVILTGPHLARQPVMPATARVS